MFKCSKYNLLRVWIPRNVSSLAISLYLRSRIKLSMKCYYFYIYPAVLKFSMRYIPAEPGLDYNTRKISRGTSFHLTIVYKKESWWFNEFRYSLNLNQSKSVEINWFVSEQYFCTDESVKRQITDSINENSTDSDLESIYFSTDKFANMFF